MYIYKEQNCRHFEVVVRGAVHKLYTMLLFFNGGRIINSKIIIQWQMHRCKSKRWPASASITTSFMNGLCCQNQIIAEEDSSTRYSQAGRSRECHGTLIFRQISQPYLNQGGHAPHITTGYWSPRFSNLPTVLTAKKPLDRRVISCLKRSYRKPRGTQLPTQNIY